MTVTAATRRSDSDKHGVGLAYRPRVGSKIEPTIFNILHEPSDRSIGIYHVEAPRSLKRLYRRGNW
jgi:hypothetical protein